MPEISENALMMSIQAVHLTIEQSSAARDAINGPEQADYDEIIEAYEITAMELKTVYEKLLAHDSGLPPYSDLVR